MEFNITDLIDISDIDYSKPIGTQIFDFLDKNKDDNLTADEIKSVATKKMKLIKILISLVRLIK